MEYNETHRTFKTFTTVWNKLKHDNILYAKLEHRPSKYLFGTNNYGEIINTLNSADGDPWDIIVPGYPPLERDIPIKIKNLEGVILMPNGNHKIIVDVHTNAQRSSKKSVQNEVYLYRKLYNRVCKRRGEVIFL